MCLKYSKYCIQLTFRTCDKSHFLAPFLTPFWEPLGLFFAILLLAEPLQNKTPKPLSKKAAPGPKMSENGLPNVMPGAPESIQQNA